MHAATLSSKFQVSVPKEVRDALGLAPGDKLVFIHTGSAVKLMRQPTMAELVGIARGASTDGVRDRDDHRERDLPSAPRPAGRAARVRRP